MELQCSPFLPHTEEILTWLAWYTTDSECAQLGPVRHKLYRAATGDDQFASGTPPQILSEEQECQIPILLPCQSLLGKAKKKIEEMVSWAQVSNTLLHHWHLYGERVN